MRGAKFTQNFPLTISYIILSAVAIIWLAPLAWMLSTTFKPELETTVLPLYWIPKSPTLGNIIVVIYNSALLRWVWNSFFVATVTTVIVLAVNAMAAYAFARIEFVGKKLLFYTVIGTLMIPEQVTVVPLYLLMSRLGLVNTYWALILPRTALAIGIFLLRQFFLGLPKELEEAAEIDGCNRLITFIRIILPLTKPAMSALAIFTFVGSWNSFMWPLVSVTTERMFTLPVGLANFQGTYNVEYAKLMGAALIASVPVLIVFLIFQRHFIKGVALTGIKG